MSKTITNPKKPAAAAAELLSSVYTDVFHENYASLIWHILLSNALILDHFPTKQKTLNYQHIVIQNPFFK